MMNQDDDVIDYAQTYLNAMLFGLYIMGLTENLRKFMVALDQPLTATIGTFIATCIHPLWCYIFITKMDLDTTGAAISSTITFTISFSIMMA